MKNLTFKPYNRKTNISGFCLVDGHYILLPGTWQIYKGGGRVPNHGIFTPRPFPEEVKTIDVNANEWWDRVNGNSYFSASVTVNFGMPDSYRFLLPFQYGYGDHYLGVTRDALQFLGVKIDGALWTVKDAGIILRTNKVEGCKKRDLLNI